VSRNTYAVIAQELFASDARRLNQIKFLGPLGKRLEWEELRLVEAKELGDGGIRQLLSPLRRRQAVLQDDLDLVPPAWRAPIEREDEAVTVPDAHNRIQTRASSTRGETELVHGAIENVVCGDENAGALLDRLGRVIERVDGDRAAANAVRLLEERDIDTDSSLGGELPQKVGSGGSCSAGSCLQVSGCPEHQVRVDWEGTTDDCNLPRGFTLGEHKAQKSGEESHKSSAEPHVDDGEVDDGFEGGFALARTFKSNNSSGRLLN
jgi:hypothetical protein